MGKGVWRGHRADRVADEEKKLERIESQREPERAHVIFFFGIYFFAAVEAACW